MDEQFKERVVGAAVLVLAAVVFIPMILSGPESDDGSPAGTPSVPGSPAREDFSSRIVPLKPDRKLSGATQEAPAAVPKVAVRTPPAPVSKEASKPAPRAGKPAEVSAPREQAKPPAAKLKLSKSTAVSPRPAAGWVVQLGSFSNKRNALGLKERLVKKGYPAFVETTSASGVEVTRVYVGPEPTRDGARARLPRLLQETKLKGIVTRYEG